MSNTKQRQPLTQPKFRWDPWQKEVLEHEGNITIRAGRQVGKSEVISAKSCRFARENPGTTTLIIAASQRQSSLLFEKVRGNFDRLEDKGEKWYSEPPTLTRIMLNNGSRIYSLPAGRTGYFIRGFTIDLLIADEAAYIPEQVWNAVIPMIAVSKKMRGMGFIILLSTPFGKGGYFYNSFTDEDFKQFHVSSEDCSRIPMQFLDKEKERLTRAQYMQEYLGEFTDEWNQYFPTQLIKNSMKFIEWSKRDDQRFGSTYYLGVDFAGHGGDENAFAICELLKTDLKIVKVIVAPRNVDNPTIDVLGRIDELYKVYNFKKMFVDDGGLGSPITDFLMAKYGRRIVGLNNASKKIKVQGEEKKRGILKEDLYSNALMLMETGKLSLISDLKLLRSLKSITFEHSTNQLSRKIKIYGNYTHITEAMVRACWCIKERGLNLYVY